MIYSLLKDNDTCYISLHAESALHSNSNSFITDELKTDVHEIKGIYSKSINATVLEEIYSYPFDDKNICIDFDKIEDISENSLNRFVNKISSNCSREIGVYFINISSKICEKIDEKIHYERIHSSEDIESIFFGNENIKKKDYAELQNQFEILFKKKLGNIIKRATEKKEEVHASIPVYLDKYVNFKKMVTDDTSFIRFSIYKLALKLIQEGIFLNDYSANKDKRFFFHTLNGGYIATQLAELFNLNMMYLDHLGPIETVHRKHFEKNIQDNINYVIVSDVICLGGEVGRAKTIIEYCGGSVCAEVCLLDIKTIQEEYLNNKISLYTISKNSNDINYTIKTDFCSQCQKEKAE